MSKNKSLFVWNNQSYSATELVDLQEVPEHIATVQSALRFCLSQDSEWTLQTSGSTGAPKTLALSREMIYGSARATLDAFELVPGSRAALVLPAKYIGGFMMVVRSYIGQLTLHLCEPRGLPYVPEGLDFVPMTPAQFIALQEARKQLKVKNLLLGGSALPARYDTTNYPDVCIGYGMTETASHVALRSLGSTVYTAVGATEFSVNTDSCLCISAPHLGIVQLQTQDRVRLLDKKRFHYEGRLDHVINSGGIKLHPEKFESVCDGQGIQAVMSAKGHERYGQVPVMVLRTMDDVKGLKKALRHWEGAAMPKEVCIVPEWPLLENGKLDRLKLQSFIKSHLDRLFPL
ncbi:AMP-binding protein [Schleiferiaceae bacterium]|nr:AMP-binding protein [Schleiferiaceae bacterium]